MGSPDENPVTSEGETSIHEVDDKKISVEDAVIELEKTSPIQANMLNRELDRKIYDTVDTTRIFIDKFLLDSFVNANGRIFEIEDQIVQHIRRSAEEMNPLVSI